MAADSPSMSEQQLMDSFAGISAGVMQSTQRITDSLQQIQSRLQALQNSTATASLRVKAAGIQHLQPVSALFGHTSWTTGLLLEPTNLSQGSAATHSPYTTGQCMGSAV